MSDTSTLFGIKYKGKMIELPKDSSVSWNDLEDKPVIIEPGGTQTVTHYYDIVSYELLRNLRQNGSGWGYNGTLLVSKASITNAINALSSLLTDDLKNIWWIELEGLGDDDWNVDVVIDIDNEEVLYFSGDMGLTLKDEYLGEDGSDWIIDVNDPQIVLDDDDSVQVYIYPVNFITSDGQTVTSLTYKETIKNPDKWYFDSSHIKQDASLGILWDISTNSYTKAQIDTSIANNYASKNDVSAFITNNDISAFITSNDVSIYLTDNDISTFITANDISTKLEANDVSLFASKSDVSALDTSVSLLWDSSTQGGGGSGTVSLQYLTQAEYDALQTIDQNTLYLIS